MNTLDDKTQAMNVATINTLNVSITTSTSTLPELYIKLENAYDNNLLNLQSILANYSGTDWLEHVFYFENTYNKNLIFSNDMFDIYIIAWLKDQATRIHDHPLKGCLLKVLQGSFTENIYINDLKTKTTKFYKEKSLNPGDISFKINKGVLHQIVAKADSVSIHIYSPNNYVPQVYDSNEGLTDSSGSHSGSDSESP